MPVATTVATTATSSITDATARRPNVAAFPLSVTGCWEGALLSDAGAAPQPFALRQPPRDDAASPNPVVTLGGGRREPVRVLEGAARSLVALVTDAQGQLLLETRVRGTRMEGRWLRRDETGAITGMGRVTAALAG